MWPGVSLSATQFNQTYLQTMYDLVTALGEGGIYTIVDCHQGCVSGFMLILCEFSSLLLHCLI